MASSAELSSDPAVARLARLRKLGAYLTGTEAHRLASRLLDGESLSSALNALPGSRRPQAERLLAGACLTRDPDRLVDVLLGIVGARTASSTTVDPLWTMPGHLAQSSPLTSSVPALVRAATTSVVCSTYNFAATSELWDALAEVARRPGVAVRLYVDTGAAEPSGGWQPPSTEDVARHLAPARVFRTTTYDGRLVVNHAKLVVVDSRFVLVTSANFSYRAAYTNVEFGVRIDNGSLAESVERELRATEGVLYEPVRP